MTNDLPHAPAQGLLLVDKPVGPSSARVVAIVKRLMNTRSTHANPSPRRSEGVRGAQPKPMRIKVGHAGTLDPLASGLLICCVGKATKSAQSLMGAGKSYRAQVDLSAFSATDDAEGPLEPIADATPPTLKQIQQVCSRWVGTVMQTPPAFSAVHVGGQRAYKLARAGEVPQVSPRPVVIHDIAIQQYDWPALELTIDCGKGVYIRSLARDIGRGLGTGGYLTALRRTRIEPFDVADALTPTELEQCDSGQLRARLLEPPTANS